MNAWLALPVEGWIAVAVAVLLAAVTLVILRQRRRREPPIVALVRRRRELMSQLQQLAGEETAEIVRAESRRLRAGTTTVEVLEAAVERAERMTERGELGPNRRSKA